LRLGYKTKSCFNQLQRLTIQCPEYNLAEIGFHCQIVSKNHENAIRSVLVISACFPHNGYQNCNAILLSLDDFQTFQTFDKSRNLWKASFWAFVQLVLQPKKFTWNYKQY